MSERERLTPPDDYLLQLKALKERFHKNLSEIQAHESKIKALEDDSRAAYSEFSDLLEKYGVPEETKFTVAAYSHFPKDPERYAAFYEYLRGIDEQIKAVAGETVAWLTSEVQTVSTSFNPAIPPTTEHAFTLRVGILTQDAKLVVGEHGELTVPVERAVDIPLINVYMTSEHPSLEDELRPRIQMFSGYGAPYIERTPELDLGGMSKEATYPVVFGNNAVEELFDRHSLEAYNEVIEALEALNASLV